MLCNTDFFLKPTFSVRTRWGGTGQMAGWQMIAHNSLTVRMLVIIR